MDESEPFDIGVIIAIVGLLISIIFLIVSGIVHWLKIFGIVP